MTRLTALVSIGFVILACDDTGVDPVQQGIGGTTGIGGNKPTPSSGGAGQGGQSTGGKSTGGQNTGGNAGAATTVPQAGATSGTCPIVPTEASGWVDGTNACKIQGAWYSYNDCNTSPTDCTTNHLPPVGSTTGFPNIGGKMCTSGTTVAINQQYELKWGAGIGLNLNQAAGSDVKGGIAPLPHALKGFSFTFSGTKVPPEVRVNFPTAATEKTAHFKAITSGAGNYTVLFSDAKQGSWVATPVALVNGDINAIQFQVVGSDTTTVPFDFCVEGLTALY